MKRVSLFLALAVLLLPLLGCRLTAPRTPSNHTVEVQANEGWQATGIQIKA